MSESSAPEGPLPPSSPLAPVLARQALATPDRLDQLFVVIGWRGWLALLALAVLVGTALLWSCLARVPETVQGAGVLVGPRGVRPLQAPYESQVVEVKVRPGQEVAAREVLAVVNLPDLQLQQVQAQTRLDELHRQDARESQLEQLRIEQEDALRQARARAFDQAIKEGQEVLTGLEEKANRLLRGQREQATKSRREAATLREGLAEKVAKNKRLVEERLLPAERLQDLEARLLESGLSLANLDLQLAQIDIKEVENAQAVAQQRGRVADLRLQRLQLDTQTTQLRQEIAQTRQRRLVLRQEQEDRLHRVVGMLKEYGTIRSPYAGRVTELLLQPGQVLQTGARVGSLTLEEEEDTPLTHLAYFPVAIGKRIHPGMAVRVTPTTVQRERYGGMIGTVRRVSAFPITRQTAAAVLGNPELVTGLLPAEGVIEVEVDLVPADTPSGYRWTSAGPPQAVTAGTTTVTRVTVEERAPITYLLPLLRSLWEGQDQQSRIRP